MKTDNFSYIPTVTLKNMVPKDDGTGVELVDVY